MRNLWALFLIVALLFTQGCGTAPRVIEKPIYVEVPVSEPCLDAIPNEPPYETKFIQRDDHLDRVATAYLVEIEQRKIHITELRALLAGCVKP